MRNSTRLFLLIVPILFLPGGEGLAQQDLEDDLIYYEIGGGRALGGPASYRRNVRIGGSASAGFGYSCGKFDLGQNLRGMFDGFSNGLDKAVDTLTYAASSAIQSLPLYLLRQANPNLANMLENTMLRYEEAFNLAVKGCREAERQILAGGNPYYDWVKIGRQDTWRKSASSGEPVTEVQERADEEHGCVTWINGEEHLCDDGSGGPEINVVEDVVVRGYDLMVEDSGGGELGSGDSRLKEVWPTADRAAEDVKDLIGEHQITNIKETVPEGRPGRGAVAPLHEMAADIRKQIEDGLEDNLNDPGTPIDLGENRVAGLVINQTLIEALLAIGPEARATAIDRIATEFALLRAMERVNLARRVLIVGMADPHVAASPAKDLLMDEILPRLNEEHRLLMDEYTLRKQVAQSAANVLVEQHLRRRFGRPTDSGGRFDAPLIDGAVLQ